VNTSQIGRVGEAAFVMRCTLHDIVVCQPIDHNSRYDYVVDVNGQFYRVQVKSSTTKYKYRGKFKNYYQFNTSRRKASKATTYQSNEIDILAFYAIDIDKFWIIPYNQLNNTTTYNIYPDKDSPYLENFTFR